MKIVHVLDLYDETKNGVATATERNVRALRQMGHQVIVVSTGKAEKDKVTVDELKIPFFQHLVDEQGFTFAKSDQIKFHDAFLGADIIHFHLPTPFCIQGEKIARQMNIPTIASFHLQPQNITYTLGMGHNVRINEQIYRQFEDHFYGKFNYIHCPSAMMADELKKRHYRAELRIISNGVNDIFKPTEHETDHTDEDIFNILMVGRLSREKRQDLLIKAIKKSRYKDKIQLIFAGQGPEQKRLEKMTYGFPHQPTFNFYSQSELVKLMHQADLYIHAADIEVEGLSCLEALSSGLIPVIANSDLSATKEFALHENSLFKAGDAEDLAQKIDYWIEHPEERKNFSKHYAELGLAMGVDRTSRQLEQLYEDAIAKHKEVGYPKPPKPKAKRSFVKLPKKFTSSRKKKPSPERNKIREAGSTLTDVIAFPFKLVVWFIALILLYLVHGFRIIGHENIRQLDRQGAVSISNHILYLDSLMALTAFFPKTLHVISLPSNFELPIAGHMVKLAQSIPAPTDTQTGREFLKQTTEKLEQNRIIHFFPEGILLKDYSGLREFQNGAFHVAVKANKPIIPMAIRKVTRNDSRRHFVIPRARYLLLIGEPINPDSQLNKKQRINDLRDRSYLAMETMLNEQLFLRHRFYIYDFARIIVFALITRRMLHIFF